MPDYEVVEWNEGNTSMDKCEYVRWCVENKRWAFLSDYVKADVLTDRGGVFLDTDVVTHRSLGSFLSHRAFSGFECRRLPFTAVWGSEAGHAWPRAALEYLENWDVGSVPEEPNTKWMTRLLVERFGIDPMIDTYQEGAEGVAIYPSETLCLGAHVGWATHLFAGSWVPEGQRGRYSVAINDMREAAMRVENFAPGVALGVARLITFADWGQEAEVMGASRGKWTSDDLPAVVGLGRATHTLLEMVKYLVRVYWSGVKRLARRRVGAARGTNSGD